jgi:hypothetical protein
MKLTTIAPRKGMQWVRLGVLTFLGQPLILSSFFFMYFILASLLRLVPLMGNVVALVLLPSFTVGFMEATRMLTAQKNGVGNGAGQKPSPLILLTAFRQGRSSTQAMLTLGALYAGAVVLVIAASALADGGQFAQMYFGGAQANPEAQKDDVLMASTLLICVLYTPVSMLFWHAPALVLWHGVAPVKAIFFSTVACWRNLKAFALYSLGWVCLSVCMGTLLAMLGLLISQSVLGIVMLPAMVILVAMFFTSQYFSFIDSFDFQSPTTGEAP